MMVSTKGYETMKKTLLFTMIIIAILAVLPACAFLDTTIVRGSGVLASETRSVSDFDSIEITGSADVTVAFGESESVVIEAEDNLLPLITTRVQGKTLVIGFKPNTSVSPREPIRVAVTAKTLRQAVIGGSGNFEIPEMQADKVKFVLTGSGTIRAAGTADFVEASIQGSGTIDCIDLQAASARATITGSGNIHVYANQSLQAEIGGSGTITYQGDPVEVDTSITGSGDIRRL
jgi:hypothetical protein